MSKIHNVIHHQQIKCPGKLASSVNKRHITCVTDGHDEGRTIHIVAHKIRLLELGKKNRETMKGVKNKLGK